MRQAVSKRTNFAKRHRSQTRCLQHEDGHSHLLAGAVPNCRAYDPTFAGEVAVILQYGMTRMLDEQRDEYFYLMLMNENYAHPELPAGAAEGVIRGMYLLQDAGKPKKGELRVRCWAAAPSCASPSPPPGCWTRTSA